MRPFELLRDPSNQDPYGVSHHMKKRMRLCWAMLSGLLIFAGSSEANDNRPESTTQTLAISGMVTGFAPDAATGVMYPSHLSGTLYSINGSERSPIGWYSEKTQYPVLDAGANPLGFIGTVGVSRFTMERNGKTLGTLTTLSLSRLVPENGPGCKTDFAKGILCVRADGVVIGGTGIYRNSVGTFTTRSTVNLGLLTLETTIQLTLREKKPKATHLAAASPSCCRPAAFVQPASCARPQQHGLLSHGCRILNSPLRCVFR